MTKYILLKQNAQGGLSDLVPALPHSELAFCLLLCWCLNREYSLVHLLECSSFQIFKPLCHLLIFQNHFHYDTLQKAVTTHPTTHSQWGLGSCPTGSLIPTALTHSTCMSFFPYMVRFRNASTTPYSYGRPQSPAQCPAWTFFDEVIKEWIHDNATERSGRRLEGAYVNWKGKLWSPCISLKDQPLKLLVKFFCNRHTPPMSIQQRIPSTTQWWPFLKPLFNKLNSQDSQGLSLSANFSGNSFRAEDSQHHLAWSHDSLF